MGTFLACSQTFFLLLLHPPPLPTAKIWGPVNEASSRFFLSYALSTISKVRIEGLWTNEKKKKYLCKSRRILLQVLWSFQRRSWFLGKKEENNWIDRPEIANIVMIVLTLYWRLFMFIMTGKKGQNVRKRKRPSLWQGRKEIKGKEKDETNQSIKERTNQRSK